MTAKTDTDCSHPTRIYSRGGMECPACGLTAPEPPRDRAGKIAALVDPDYVDQWIDSAAATGPNPWITSGEPCPSGHTNCTVDCGSCKGTGQRVTRHRQNTEGD